MQTALPSPRAPSPALPADPRFQALHGKPVHLTLEKLTFATCFRVSLSDGQRGSDELEVSVNANFQVRLGFEQPLVLTHDNYLRPRLNVLTGRRFPPRGTPPDQCFCRAEA